MKDEPTATPICLRAEQHLEEEEVVYERDPAHRLFPRFSEDYQGKRPNTECTKALPTTAQVIILNFLYTFVPGEFLVAWRDRKVFGEVMPRVPGAKALMLKHLSEIANKRAAVVGKPRSSSVHSKAARLTARYTV